ncbi:MFS transporter [Nocardiopsis tropica]|uniref:MFS transporter n=1 Tax=Nocardiopsis tropica TaxID=109330 RepID=A0ABU7KRR0_9ACTN|nr:MFS transporter [Nocardiopsis umidischolae]MEE2051962.1 MFS transporter [Nocardiopsis umidischolae]
MTSFRTPGARSGRQERFTRTRRWWALAAVSMLQFLIAVDVTVVNIALPSIGADLGAGPQGLTWVVAGYTLVGGGLLLLGGRICDLLGRRRMLLLGAALFGAASLVAGAASDLPWLLAARFGQGAGEALASPAAMSLIAMLFPAPRERAKALGIWGAISSSGLVGGVLLSGVITELLDWRWIFLVNLPVVAVVLVAVPLLVAPDGARRAAGGSGDTAPADASAPVRRRPDVTGAVLLTAGPLALVYGVLRAAEAPWGDPRVFGPVAAGIAALALFVLVEARSANPLVPLSFFANRIRTVANAATVLLSAALSTSFLLVTLYLQQVLGMSPLQAGLAYVPFCAAILVSATVVGRVIGALGLSGAAVAGLLATAAGTAWLSRLPVDGDLWTDAMPGMVLVGVGMGIGLIALQNAALHGVTEDDAGVASGVQRSVDQLGGATGMAVLVGAAVAAGASGDTDAAVEGYRTAFTWATAGVLVATAGVALFARRAGRA